MWFCFKSWNIVKPNKSQKTGSVFVCLLTFILNSEDFMCKIPTLSPSYSLWTSPKPIYLINKMSLLNCSSWTRIYPMLKSQGKIIGKVCLKYEICVHTISIKSQLHASIYKWWAGLAPSRHGTIRFQGSLCVFALMVEREWKRMC